MFMSKEQRSYTRTRELIRNGELPNLPISIKLKSGNEISDITPYAIVEGHMSRRKTGERTLRLFYLDKSKKAHKVDINEVEGLKVVEGSGDYKGKLMIEFTYFKGTHDGDFAEPNSRVVFATDINFGVHRFHQGIGEKKPDFYVVGDDDQYPENRSRQFPLWRVIGVYDNEPKNLVDEFKS